MEEEEARSYSSFQCSQDEVGKISTVMLKLENRCYVLLNSVMY